MQLLVITTPPDVQLACLTMEVTEQQSLMLVAAAADSDDCYMELPIQSTSLKKNSSRYGRVFHETGQWFLESFLTGHFRINEQKELLEVNRAKALNDGDLIECQGYTLMFSDFSPWKETVSDAPVLKENVSPENSVFSVLEPEALSSSDDVNDPFEELEKEAGTASEASVEVSIKTSGQSNIVVQNGMENERQKSLINVLADFNDDAPLHEQPLWTGDQQLNFRDDFLSGHPLSTQPVNPEHKICLVSESLDNSHFQQALINSLLMTLKSVSPEAIAKMTEQPARKLFQKNDKQWLENCQQTFDQLINSNAFKQQYLRYLRTCYKESCE
ncbi:hypothetical protein EOPP23_12235 [Endozoicomonas sp. OPT23]|uniref:hypothetical protein n=1 Tax=Endozoicomonas sp. OPT23 TaxID=2072845 RepID=UPI00129B8246|nr:hypothetical protein [Endozoicomonas sp. OPT23]MRI33756.1 hypothetical protein [Endozoicomonas sp. OPT23]